VASGARFRHALAPPLHRQSGGGSSRSRHRCPGGRSRISTGAMISRGRWWAFAPLTEAHVPAHSSEQVPSFVRPMRRSCISPQTVQGRDWSPAARLRSFWPQAGEQHWFRLSRTRLAQPGQAHIRSSSERLRRLALYRHSSEHNSSRWLPPPRAEIGLPHTVHGHDFTASARAAVPPICAEMRIASRLHSSEHVLRERFDVLVECCLPQIMQARVFMRSPRSPAQGSSPETDTCPRRACRSAR
jgi:hypothetical protein